MGHSTAVNGRPNRFSFCFRLIEYTFTMGTVRRGSDDDIVFYVRPIPCRLMSQSLRIIRRKKKSYDLGEDLPPIFL